MVDDYMMDSCILSRSRPSRRSWWQTDLTTASIC